MQFKKHACRIFLIGLFGVFNATAVEAQVILDDFSGDLSAFTSTVILDVEDSVDGVQASNATSFEINESGQLQLNTTTYDDVEQLAFIYDGASLNVGDELQADFTTIVGSRNFGLYVGGSAPTTGVRENYITIYGGSASGNRLSTRGFDGTIEYDNPSSGAPIVYDTLFIARTDLNEFEVGYYNGSARTVITTRTPSTENSADFIGFYADVRDAGVISAADNLRIIVAPPMSASLINSGSASVVDQDGLLVPQFTPGNAAGGGLFGRSLNVVAHQTSPLLTAGDFQYVTWYQLSRNQEHVMLGRRDLATPGSDWEIFDTGLNLFNGDANDDDKDAGFATQTQPWDSHCAINLGISGDGVIHIAYDHHSNPLNYLRSVAGAATGAWTRTDVFGVTETMDALEDSFRPGDPILLAVTYPRFVTNAVTGDMVATYRLGQSGAGNLYISNYNSQSGEWTQGREFINGNDGAPYNDSAITGINSTSTSRNPYLNDINFGPNGTLHATFTWRETANGTANHGLNYITSNNNGLTWLNDSANQVAGIGGSVSIVSPGITIGSDANYFPPGLSNSPASVDPPLGEIDRLQTLINQQGQTVDAEGGVHALMWHREDPSTRSSDDNAFDSREAAYFHYYKNPMTGEWSRSQIPRVDALGNPLDVGSRGKIVYDENGNVFAAYLSPGIARADSRNYLDPGGLVIAGATKASNYSDWTILSFDTTLYEGEPIVDQQRLLRDNVLSVMIQDTNFNQTGVTTSNIRVFDFAVASPSPVLLGDCNLDGVVDFDDISPFIVILATDGYLEQADINLDGVVDFDDISPFIILLQ